MHAREPDRAGRTSMAAEFADSCAWVAEAHASGEPEQVVGALTNIYRVLTSNGWRPSDRASLILRMQAAALDLELVRVLEEELPGR